MGRSKRRIPDREPDFKYNSWVGFFNVWVEEGLITHGMSAIVNDFNPAEMYEYHLDLLKTHGFNETSNYYINAYREYVDKVAEQELLGE